MKDSVPGLAICVERDVARYAGVVRSQTCNREIWKMSDKFVCMSSLSERCVRLKGVAGAYVMFVRDDE